MIASKIVNEYISYNSRLLKKQIKENSEKIDQLLMELRELEKKICGVYVVKSVA